MVDWHNLYLLVRAVLQNGPLSAIICLQSEMAEFEFLASGTVTSAQDFLAGAIQCGIKAGGGTDLAVLHSLKPCAVAGVFTTNAIKAAPVVVSQRRVRLGRARSIIVNSGCANACTGDKGIADAEEMARLAARKLGVSADEVLVASTGVIGVRLPIDRVRSGVEGIVLKRDGGHELARAIMTTDTFAKEVALRVESDFGVFTVGGVAKGAGMIHPQLATMLCFLTTDAHVEASLLQTCLRRAVDSSFNMVTIDGDTSPNDMVVLLANGASATAIGEEAASLLTRALEEVCVYLAKCVARDGEGATKLVEVVVEGALDVNEARAAARTIAASPLVKAAIHGSDPNWGRIVAALGRSGARMEEKRLDVYLCDTCVMRQGEPQPFDKGRLSMSLAGEEVSIRLHLNLGSGRAVAWGCDLSEEYVTINSAYTS